MGPHPSQYDEELLRRADEVLHYVWDPIGVSNQPAARDQYFGYLPTVFGMLKDKADPSQIAEHLNAIAAERMGLTHLTEQARRAAELLVAWRTRLDATRQ